MLYFYCIISCENSFVSLSEFNSEKELVKKDNMGIKETMLSKKQFYTASEIDFNSSKMLRVYKVCK